MSHDFDSPGYPYVPPEPPRKRHRLRKALLWAAAALAALIIVIWAVNAASAPQAPVHPAAGTSAAPAPGRPQESRQASSSPQSASLPASSSGPVTIGSFHGTGDWNSPLFTLDGHPLTVIYSYSGNILPGESEGDNFQADVESSGDIQQIANDIATSGGAATTLYPDTALGGASYHLSVTATGSWSFTLKEAS